MSPFVIEMTRRHNIMHSHCIMDIQYTIESIENVVAYFSICMKQIVTRVSVNQRNISE